MNMKRFDVTYKDLFNWLENNIPDQDIAYEILDFKIEIISSLTGYNTIDYIFIIYDKNNKFCLKFKLIKPKVGKTGKEIPGRIRIFTRDWGRAQNDHSILIELYQDDIIPVVYFNGVANYSDNLNHIIFVLTQNKKEDDKDLNDATEDIMSNPLNKLLWNDMRNNLHSLLNDENNKKEIQSILKNLVNDGINTIAKAKEGR